MRKKLLLIAFAFFIYKAFAQQAEIPRVMLTGIEKPIPDADGSLDPNDDKISYHWLYCGEAGSFTISSGRTRNSLEIENADKPYASFTVPAKFGRPGTIHIILAITDDGVPSLTRYKSVIVDVGI